jgi:putative ABC transport system permease protein
VTGAVALSWVLASMDARARDEYRGALLPGQVVVPFDNVPADVRQQRIDRAVAALPPGRRIVLEQPVLPGPAGLADEVPGGLQVRGAEGNDGSVVVGGGTVLSALMQGTPPARALRALDNGGAVVFDAALAPDGTVSLDMFRPDGSVDDGVVTIPAVLVPRNGASGLPLVVLSPRAVQELGWETRPQSLLLIPERLPTEAEEADAATGLGALGATLLVERGYQKQYGAVALALVGASVLVTLAGVAISVALSAAEGRADLTTLAAVGAQPGRRRVLAMWQAAFMAATGGCLGVLLGSTLAVILLAGQASYPVAVPWTALAAIAGATPVAGALVAGLFAPARLRVTRRPAH